MHITVEDSVGAVEEQKGLQLMIHHKGNELRVAKESSVMTCPRWEWEPLASRGMAERR